LQYISWKIKCSKKSKCKHTHLHCGCFGQRYLFIPVDRCRIGKICNIFWLQCFFRLLQRCFLNLKSEVRIVLKKSKHNYLVWAVSFSWAFALKQGQKVTHKKWKWVLTFTAAAVSSLLRQLAVFKKRKSAMTQKIGFSTLGSAGAAGLPDWGVSRCLSLERRMLVILNVGGSSCSFMSRYLRKLLT
jgi:hypothetical protein